MATLTRRLRVLNEAYAQLPSIECKGLCHESCSFIPLRQIEEDNIAKATGSHPITDTSIKPITMLKNVNESCPYLQLQRCTIYEQRPLICRVFGVSEDLLCRHGCKPTRVMSREEVGRVLHVVSKI